MSLPFTQNEEARKACLGKLKALNSFLDGHSCVTVSTAEVTQRNAWKHVGKMLSAMDMDDICNELERIAEWSEP